MKTSLVLLAAASLVSTISVIADGSVAAGEKPASDASATDHISGVIRTVDLEEGLLTLRDFWSTRTIHLGKTCQVSLDGTNRAAPSDLRAGHKVEVTFARHDGVRVASAVVQRDQTFTGFVATVDRTNNTIRVKHDWSSRDFVIDKDCQVVRRDGTRQPVDKLEIGRRVTVTYLRPVGDDVAQLIAETSREFKGRIESLDARDDVVRAGNLLGRRTFQLGSDCQLVVAGELGGELKDFRIGDTVVFHYEDIDGVLVANRIERVSGKEEPEPRQLTRQESPGS